MSTAENNRLDEPLNEGAGAYFMASRKVASVRSPYQLIEIFDTPELGKLMRIDGCNMLSERDEFFYHENFIHPAAITHPAPQKVLIIGGGDGGSAEELLKHPSIKSVTLCELDQIVVNVAKAHFQSVHHDIFAHPKLELRIGDGARYVESTTDHFDLVYLDLTDPAGLAEALYTQKFYADCKQVLNEGGALTLHIGSPFSHPARVKSGIEQLRNVFRIVTPYFVHIPAYGATWGFAVAADDLRPGNISAAEINARLDQRAIGDRQFYNGDSHHAMLALPEYIRNLIA